MRLPKRVKQTRKHDRKILVVFSDTHGGHRKGLLNPDTQILEEVIYSTEDGQQVELTPTPVSLNPYQKWLWDVYQKNIEETFDLADGDPVAVFHNGDLTQGIKYWDGLDFTSLGSQFFVATSNMRPWFTYDNMKWFRIVWGTDSHIAGEGSAPRIVTTLLKNDYPEVDIRTVQHSLAEFGGLTHDIAHHGPNNSVRSWLKGNTPRYYTKSMIFDAIKEGKKPPDTVFRGHFHQKVEEWVVEWLGTGRQKTLFCMTPSYQGMNEYARQRTASANRVINGHVAVEIIDGKILDVHWFTSTVDVRTKEVLA